MSDKRYDQFPAGSNASTQIILTADPTTGVLGKIPLSDLPSGGTDTNFAEDDLTATGNRVHTFDEKSLEINNSDAGYSGKLLMQPGSIQKMEMVGDGFDNSVQAELQVAKIRSSVNDGSNNYTSMVMAGGGNVNIQCVNEALDSATLISMGGDKIDVQSFDSIATPIDLDIRLKNLPSAETEALVYYDPITGALSQGVVPSGGSAANLQDVTDVGNETTNKVYVDSVSIKPSGGFYFNLDDLGNYKANGWAGAIKQDSSTGHLTIQSSIASGTAGGSPSYSGIPIDAAPNGNVLFGGNLRASNYGSGAVTGTPTRLAAFDASGNIIETVLITASKYSPIERITSMPSLTNSGSATLVTLTIPANTLNAAGQRCDARIGGIGTKGAGTLSRQLTVAGHAFAANSVSNSEHWEYYISCVRTDGGFLSITGLNGSNFLGDLSDNFNISGVDFTNSITIVVTVNTGTGSTQELTSAWVDFYDNP